MFARSLFRSLPLRSRRLLNSYRWVGIRLSSAMFWATWLCLCGCGTWLSQPAPARTRDFDLKPRVGSIQGIVTDHLGVPLAGALVQVFTSSSRLAPAIASVKTDTKGKYVLSRLIPGLYRIRINAPGFQSMTATATEIPSNQPLILNVKLLKAAEVLQAAEVDLTKYKARRNRAIFQAEAESGFSPAGLTLPDPFPTPSGELLVVTGSSPFLLPTASTNTFFSTRMVQPVNDSTRFVTTLQVGMGTTAPGRLALTFDTVTPAHHPELTLTLNRGVAPDQLQPPTRLSLRATDSWKVNDTLVVLYGLEYHQSNLGAEPAWQPIGGIRWLPSAQTQVYAEVTSGNRLADSLTPAEGDAPGWLAPFNVGAPTSLSEWELAGGQSHARRFETGLTYQVDHRTTLDTSVFYDLPDPTGFNPVGLLPPSGWLWLTPADRQNGIRILARRQLSPNFSIESGFAAGQAQTLNQSAVPESLWRSTRYHLIATQLKGSLRTGTSFLAMYRTSTGRPVFPLDPFAGRLSSLRSGLSLYLVQELPEFRFLPGKLELVFSGENLLEQTGDTPFSRSGIRLGVGRRSLRGGFGMRF
ncbi:MAG: carboxypeptidase-like regulatory domain-containing protein [Blastocatellia bacterium]|nr:carboxypeptidase-like regulatory domain-containing protein [Blastocatellia bacterium]